MQIKHRIKFLIISQMKVNCRAVFLGSLISLRFVKGLCWEAQSQLRIATGGGVLEFKVQSLRHMVSTESKPITRV